MVEIFIGFRIDMFGGICFVLKAIEVVSLFFEKKCFISSWNKIFRLKLVLWCIVFNFVIGIYILLFG